MDHREVGRYWESNAFAWTMLARQGWDVYRDAVNLPAFLELLPDIAGKKGLDVGCGEGHNTRRFAERGAQMTAIDIAPTFVRYAAQTETGQSPTSDMPNHDSALAEIQRVLRPEGFLQFSIVHPYFFPPHRRLVRDANRDAYAIEIGRYFDRIDGEIDRWLFSAAPAVMKTGLKDFEVPRFHRTPSEWLTAVIKSGFSSKQVAEPRADEETAKRVPAVADTRIAVYFLHVRCRKPLCRNACFLPDTDLHLFTGLIFSVTLGCA